MKTKLLRFKTMSAEMRDTSGWAPLDTSNFDKDEDDRIKRLQPAVQFYFDHGRLKAAAEAAGVSTTTLLDQVNRCLTVMPDGTVLGWAGLIDNLRIKPYAREAALPDGQSDEAGYAGAFGKFLRDHPQIKKAVDKAIRRGLGSKHIRAGTNTVESIHRLFLRECQSEKVAAPSYPFNTKNRARRSLERYIKKKLQTQAPSEAWVGATAVANQNVGNGETSFDLAVLPFDMCGFDAHHFDVIGVIRVDGPAGPQFIPVTRIWIYALVDYGSRVVPGYAVSIRDEPTGAMLEEAWTMAQTPWKRKELDMHDVRYHERAGMPVGSIDGLVAYRPAIVRGDNGTPGFSNRMLKRVRRKLGCAVSFAGIGSWWQNPLCEALFRELERRGFHRTPSSMGTGPGDPMRDDPVGKAVEYNITMDELLTLVDILIANYNGESSAGVGHQTRLDVMRRTIDPDVGSVQPALPFPDSPLSPRFGITVETHVARGARKPGNEKNVYVQVDKCTYTNETLRCRHDLVGTALTVHVDEADMRTVEAFLPDGRSLGTLNVRERGWKHSKHSRDLRKTINRMRDKLPLDSYDLVADFVDHLAKKTVEAAKKQPKKISAPASQLAETLRTTGLPVPTVNSSGRPSLKLVVPPARPSLPTTKKPSWA